ncbi:hypothetical protein K5549_008999 [Capra hircus]|nr:hypothetical protein K5549_008999 [Capra hircus]
MMMLEDHGINKYIILCKVNPYLLKLKKKSQSVDITAPGFNPLAGAGKQMPQASKPPAPKTPIIEEEQNNAANSQKHPSRRSELKRFYTIGEYHDLCK